MPTILVIDDEEPIRALLGRALQREGYQVLLAANGREGVALCQATRPDLVVTDLLMPEQEGLETIMALRRQFPRLPVIAISGGGLHGQLDFLPVAARLGATRALRKPFELSQFMTAVRELLAGAATDPA